MTVDEAEARRRLAEARVGHLATVGADGRPGLVPFCFAVDGDVLYSAVDHKSKRSPQLRRLADIDAHPDVTVLADAWSEDWDRLWWVRARGRAHVTDDDAERAVAVRLLADKYDQYRRRPPEGPVVVVRMEELRWWSATGR